MAYVRVNGFSGTEDWLSGQITRADACLLAPNTPLCAQAQSLVKQQLHTLYGKVGGELKGLVASNPVLAEALVGTWDPKTVLGQASALAQSFTKDPFDQAAYKLYYTHGRAGFDMLESYAQLSPALGTAVQISKLGVESAFGIKSWIDRTHNKGIDTAGIADLAGMAGRIAASAQSIAANLPGNQAAQIAAEVVGYLGVAAGCVGSIAAGSAAGPWGTAAGAVMCGISVLAKIFTSAGSSPPAGPPVVFMFEETYKDLIPNDAARLAALLKYRYNVQSLASLISAAGVDPSGYPLIGERKPFPGVSLRDIAALAYGLSGGGNFGGGFDGAMARPVAKWWYPDLASSMELRFGYIYNHIGQGLRVREVVEGGERAAQHEFTDKGAAAATRVLEWCNFFAATTLVNPADVNVMLPPMAMPMRFKAGGFSGGDWTDDSDWFKGKTSLIGSFGGDGRAEQAVGMLRLAHAFSYLLMQYKYGKSIAVTNGPTTLTMGNDMIASLPTISAGDPMRAVRAPVNPRAVNGKVPSPAALKTAITQMRARLSFIESAAKKAAEAGFKVFQLAGEAKRQQLMLQAGAPAAVTAAGMTTAALKAMLEARGGAELVSEAGKTCIAAGGAYFPGGAQCDINPTTKELENCRKPPAGYTGKLWTCVPKGTPGGVLTPGAVVPGGPEVKKETSGVKKETSGVGTILAVAGAGLLLMRLLRS